MQVWIWKCVLTEKYLSSASVAFFYICSTSPSMSPQILHLSFAFKVQFNHQFQIFKVLWIGTSFVAVVFLLRGNTICVYFLVRLWCLRICHLQFQSSYKPIENVTFLCKKNSAKIRKFLFSWLSVMLVHLPTPDCRLCWVTSWENPLMKQLTKQTQIQNRQIQNWHKYKTDTNTKQTQI